MNEYLQLFLGKTGLSISLIFLFLSYLTIRFSLTPEKIINFFRSRKKEVVEDDFEDSILAEEQIPENKNLIVLGYSQGVSVATRYIKNRQLQCSQLILHSGGLPIAGLCISGVSLFRITD